MSKIEYIKSYEGQALDTIFFRPMLTGESAEQLGIKVLYNVPAPTILHFWKQNGNVLKRHYGRGWSGGDSADKFQKRLELKRVKAEMSYAADDYFSTVYELIAGRSDVNMQDLSGTELEEAETALFRSSIAESLRATMWCGNYDRDDEYLDTFDGFVANLVRDNNDSKMNVMGFIPGSSENWAEKLLKKMWESSSAELRQLRSEGQLVFFVTSDVYNAYEESLDNVATEAAYLAKQEGREGLYYRGIPVVDVQIGSYKDNIFDLPRSFALLTDRRNLALAVNTSDYPGTEVRMWYNPDEMENRQRAVFMAAADYLMPELVTFAMGYPMENFSCDRQEDSGTFLISGLVDVDQNWFESLVLCSYDADGAIINDHNDILSGGAVNYELENEDVVSFDLSFRCNGNLIPLVY